MLRSQRGRELVGRMPADRVLTESDGPFATFGDRPIQPWDVGDAVNRLADIWLISAQDVEQRLAENLRRLVRGAQ
jgi:TatD DNase family protein